MMLKMKNKDAVNNWIAERGRLGREVVSIKGKPPEGATYSDGDPIERDVNIAWQDTTTGEVINIEYFQEGEELRG